MVAGVGFRRGATVADIVAAVAAARAVLGGAAAAPIAALATADFKAEEAGFREAAACLGVPPIACAIADLAAVADQTLTRSARVAAAVGVPSVAEAAALVAAGPGARLAGPRVAHGNATCALAIRKNT